MRIDRKTLNLVIPILDGTKTVKKLVKDGDGKEHEQDVEEDNVIAYVHAAPISREVFETYFLPMARAFSKIYAGGLGEWAGPRVAALLLKQSAQELGVWDGPAGVQAGLVAEIRRLANVIMPMEAGWELIPLDSAMKGKLLNEDDVSEVENAITFFTVVSAIHKKSDVPMVVAGAARLWGAETSLSNCTEFKDSLPTLTMAASSGARAPQSSIPS